MVNSRSPCLTIWPSRKWISVEIARDAGAHLDRIDRDEAADIFVLVGDRRSTGLATVTVGGGGAPAARLSSARSPQAPPQPKAALQRSWQ